MERKFEIHAYLLCHDVRLMIPISTIIEQAEVPDMTQANMLLSPIAEEIISSPRYRCGGCQYEFISLTVNLL